MVRLRRIPAVRAANVLALTLGIPYGIVALLSLLFIFPAQPAGVNLGFVASAFIGWAFAIVFLWIFVAIACALYNVIAGRLGGIELEFTTIPPQS